MLEHTVSELVEEHVNRKVGLGVWFQHCFGWLTPNATQTMGGTTTKAPMTVDQMGLNLQIFPACHAQADTRTRIQCSPPPTAPRPNLSTVDGSFRRYLAHSRPLQHWNVAEYVRERTLRNGRLSARGLQSTCWRKGLLVLSFDIV